MKKSLFWIVLLFNSTCFSQSNDSIHEQMQVRINHLKDSVCDLLIHNAKTNGGIIITDFDITTNSIGYPDVEFGIYNCSSKRIKYIGFTLKALNSVGDQVGALKTVKGVGFVEPNDFSNWVFDNVWISELVNSFSISSIKLTFEDGTIKNVTNIGKIRLDNLLGGEFKEYFISYSQKFRPIEK